MPFRAVGAEQPRSRRACSTGWSPLTIAASSVGGLRRPRFTSFSKRAFACSRGKADQVHVDLGAQQPRRLAVLDPYLQQVVGATGFEPVTSSVSGHARPFARSVAALHGTTSTLLTRVTDPGTAVRREVAYGIAADKLLTGGREPGSFWRTSVRAETDG